MQIVYHFLFPISPKYSHQNQEAGDDQSWPDYLKGLDSGAGKIFEPGAEVDQYEDCYLRFKTLLEAQGALARIRQ